MARGSLLDVSRLDAVIEERIEAGDCPGAVVVIGHRGEIVYRRAAGYRMLVPESRPMQIDTIFDLASLTKPIATATSILQLAECGRVLLRDPVGKYLPLFAGNEKRDVTVHHLLTHSGGLKPYEDYPGQGLDAAEIVPAICRAKLEAVPGDRGIYSCLGYILLGEIVRTASGQPLDVYCRREVFEPLGMTATMFSLPDELRPRCAATEHSPEGVLCGRVHDDNARALGGVAGNAGLFSTARDLSRFCQMMLNLGELDGARVLSAAMVRRATSPQSTHRGDPRGMGWAIDGLDVRVLRGDVFPIGGYGHGGFTGTSLWIDPASATFVIVLTNRCHPTRDGTADNVRTAAANIAGAAFAHTAARVGPPKWLGRTESGLDRLAAEDCNRLRGRKVGLITNHTAITRQRRHVVNVLRDSHIELVALFCPEHGLGGECDEPMKAASTFDEATALTVHSLFSGVHRPTEEMLQGIDTLVFDTQDIGVRYYTYTTTMCYCMEEAARLGLRFVVLDRPNPITGLSVEGPCLAPPFQRLSAYHRVPIRHGLTTGELALLANAEYGIGCELEVVPCQRWHRAQWFDQTGLPWVNPSPNIRSLTQATLYPVLGSLEASRLSVGRGTDQPFEMFGAPYIEGERLAERLNEVSGEHLRFMPVTFRPASHTFAGQICSGCFMFTTDRDRLRPVRAGLHVARALVEMYPDDFDVEASLHLIGSARVIEAIRDLMPVEEIIAGFQDELAQFEDTRKKYLLHG